MYETLNSWDLMARVEHQYRSLLEDAEERRLWKAIQDGKATGIPHRSVIERAFKLIGIGQNGRFEWKL